MSPPPPHTPSVEPCSTELCFRVSMMHRYRRDLVRGGAESAMTKQKLQQRMREQ